MFDLDKDAKSSFLAKIMSAPENFGLALFVVIAILLSLILVFSFSFFGILNQIK